MMMIIFMESRFHPLLSQIFSYALTGLLLVFQPTSRKVMEISSEFSIYFSLCFGCHKLLVKLRLKGFEVLRCLMTIIFYEAVEKWSLYYSLWSFLCEHLRESEGLWRCFWQNISKSRRGSVPYILWVRVVLIYSC